MFAILETGSKQYKVEEGDVLEVELLETDKISKANTVNFDSVLLVNDKELYIGQPFVKDARIRAKVLEEFKSPKIIVFKKKAKKRYKRTQGHRQKLHLIQIDKIEITPPKDVEDVSEKPTPAPKEKQAKTQVQEKKVKPAPKEKPVKTPVQEKKQTKKQTRTPKEKPVKTQAQEKKVKPAPKEKQAKTQAQEKKQTKKQTRIPKEKPPDKEKEKE